MLQLSFTNLGQHTCDVPIETIPQLKKKIKLKHFEIESL